MSTTVETFQVPMPQPQPSDSYRPDFYSPEEVQQILNLAIARQMTVDQLSHHQLLEIADEMGITPSELEIAKQEWRHMQGMTLERQEFDRYRQGRFRRRATRYLIVNGFLAVIIFLGTGGFNTPWFVVALLWGMLLALDALNVYGMKGDRYESAFQGWRRRRQLKRSVSNLLNRFLGT